MNVISTQNLAFDDAATSAMGEAFDRACKAVRRYGPTVRFWKSPPKSPPMSPFYLERSGIETAFSVEDASFQDRQGDEAIRRDRSNEGLHSRYVSRPPAAESGLTSVKADDG
jgi:hypothetical protein